jgi:hypothetical protein
MKRIDWTFPRSFMTPRARTTIAQSKPIGGSAFNSIVAASMQGPIETRNEPRIKGSVRDAIEL